MDGLVRRERLTGPFFILAASFFWSFSGLLIKLIPWDALSINGLRSILAAFVLAAYNRSFRPVFTRPVILAAVLMSMTSITFVLANKLTTAANAIVLQYYAPLLIVIITAVANRKMPSFKNIIASVSVVGGILLLFLDGLGSGTLLGNITAVFSGTCFAMLFISLKMKGAKPGESMFIGNLINFIVAIPFYFGSVTFEPVSWFAIIGLGIFQFGLGFVCFSIGIKRTQPIPASLLSTLEPILNPIWVFLFIGEYPGKWALAGIIIVLVSVVGYYVSEWKTASIFGDIDGNGNSDVDSNLDGNGNSVGNCNGNGDRCR